MTLYILYEKITYENYQDKRNLLSINIMKNNDEFKNTLNYFIECVNTEAKEAIQIEGRINGKITDKVIPLNSTNVSDFFFNNGEFVNAEHIEFVLDSRIKWFLQSKKTTYNSESLYLSLEFIEKKQLKNNKEYKILYPIFFVEVSYIANKENVKFSIVDYEPYFNFSLFDGLLSEEEKNQIREKINDEESWDSKVFIFKENLSEEIYNNIKSAPLLFIASVPKFYERVSKEIEYIKKRYSESIKNTALKYFLSSCSIENYTDYNNKYIEVFELNREQEKAVTQALHSSFTVITGPPGTGKSQIVLNLLVNLYFNNKTVLFASKNNKAVNTVLKKMESLATYYFPFIRLGNRIEKRIGKQKILGSLRRPNGNIDLTVKYSDIVNLKKKINQIYDNIDESLIKFRKFYDSTKKLDHKASEIDNYKANYIKEKIYHKIIDYIEKVNNKSNLSYELLIKKSEEFFDNILKFNKQKSIWIKYTKSLDSELLKIIDTNPNILIPVEGKENLKLQSFKKEVELLLNNKKNFFLKFLHNIFKNYYKNKYLKKYKLLFFYQNNKIQDYFFKIIKNLDFINYYNAILLFEKSFDYTLELKKKSDLEEFLMERAYPSFLNEFNKLFIGITDEIEKFLSEPNNNKITPELLTSKINLFKTILDFVKFIINYNYLYNEMKQQHKSILTIDDKIEIDNKLNYYKKKITEKSTILFSNHLIKKIDLNKPVITQALTDYFEKWKDNELLSFYSKLKKHFGIWVTTNLSTAFNVPNKPNIYDYVIIDEASQNDMASAIPLLFRAKKAIIIGDPNQLRHITNLKNREIYSIAERTKLKDNQLTYFHYEKYSAYDLAKKRYIDSTKENPIQLSNHYRSYSDIVKFANIIVRDYKLFPKKYINSNVDKANIQIGIHWHNVEGIYLNNNTNLEEIKAIIQFLDERKNLLKDVSIGIITPFSNQAKLISEMLNKFNLQEIDVNENIIASTVHKFQGDERDVILYSPVISNEILIRKENTLKWANNQVNLLNVAISRARSSLIVFGNMNFCSQNDGLHKVLIDYINSISQRGVKPEFIDDFSGTEMMFYNSLAENGIEFEYQVPVENGIYILDFVIKTDDHYINIELDGRQHLHTIQQDNVRDNRMRELGYEVFRFSNEYIQENLSIVIDSLKKI